MKRLIVFANRPLNELRRRAVRLDELAAQGLAEYWDLSPLYRGLYLPEPSEVDRPYARRFEDWGAVDAALAAADGCLLMPTFLYEPGMYRALRAMSRSKCVLVLPRLHSCPTPPPSAATSVWGRLRALSDPGRLRRAAAKRALLAARAAGLLRGFDLALTVGEAGKAGLGGLPRLEIHHCDFDDWRATRDSDPRLVPGRYGVFLDMYYAGHPDHALEGLPPVDAGHYFRALNSFFERLEKRHGVEIVVAAHPKADYRVNPFGGRKLFRLKTRELARHAEFAVNHFSTSMSYAVFGDKPLFIADSDEMAVTHKPSGQEAWPRMYADVLRARYVNLDHSAPEDELLSPVDAAAYEDYRYRYLVSRGSEGRSTADMLADYLRGGAPARESRHSA